MTSETTNGAPETNIATMTADDLDRHITDLVKDHCVRLRTLKALMRARMAEEEAS